MPKALFQKLALYSILPCLLVFLAIFLNGLFQPQLQWKLTVLESKGDADRVETPGVSTTTLFREPFLRGYSKEGWRCFTINDVVYTQSKLLQDKLTLEQWVDANNRFTFGLLLLTILHAAGNAIYLLTKQKVNWGKAFAIILLASIGVVALVTVLGPITGIQFGCGAHVKVNAELTKISLDGMPYAFMGLIVNILAVIVMVKRYLQKTGFDQVDEEFQG